MSGLSGAYLSLLMAIQEDPRSTVSDLVERVPGSKPTIIKRLKYLREKRIFLVQALLNYHNLGLEAVDVLIDTKTLDDVTRLEEVATNHPYTVYRSRCFGSHNGMFLQFRVPFGTKTFVEDLIDLLQEEGVITSSEVFTIGGEPTIRSFMRLSAWNAESMSWKFDWKSWLESRVEPVRFSTPKGKSGKALEWLTKSDLHTLQQLMLDGKRSHTEMIRSIEEQGVSITPQTFGRRLRMIEEDCVSSYRVALDPIAFDTITSVLVRGKAKKKFLKDLYSRMSRNPIPFESTLRVSDDELFWSMRMPPSHLSSLLTNLHSNLEGMTVTLLDYSQSFAYSIWPETLDEDAQEWKKSKEFLIDQVLN